MLQKKSDLKEKTERKSSKTVEKVPDSSQLEKEQEKQILKKKMTPKDTPKKSVFNVEVPEFTPRNMCSTNTQCVAQVGKNVCM